MYPSGQKDHDGLSEERSPSASSKSSKDEDLEMGGPEDSSDGLVDIEPPIQSVVGHDGLREVIMLPIWTVNDFTCKIKETHFKRLRAKYQIPDNIPLCLPRKSEKCYYNGLEDVGFMSKC